jgi:hypothetical protein
MCSCECRWPKRKFEESKNAGEIFLFGPIDERNLRRTANLSPRPIGTGAFYYFHVASQPYSLAVLYSEAIHAAKPHFMKSCYAYLVV